MTNEEQLCKEYIISNYEHLKEIADRIREERDELVVKEYKELEDEIFEQCEEEINLALIEDITKTLAVDYETAHNVLEMKHIKGLLK